MTGKFRKQSPLPLPRSRVLTLWDMREYPNDKIVHVLAKIAAVKENVAHHRATNGNWTPQEREKCANWMQETLPWLDDLGLVSPKDVTLDFIRGIRGQFNLDHVSATANAIRTMLESELKNRRFFTLESETANFYGNTQLAGQDFKDNFPNANIELSEAGS